MTTPTPPPDLPPFDTFEYLCPDCRRTLVRYAPDDTTPSHPDPDAAGQACPGAGLRAIFLGHTREPAP